jgi:hypothetical protein
MTVISVEAGLPIFAFGSNLHTEQLRDRCGAVQVLGVARLPGHCLKFHKVSLDGSGKADAFETGAATDVVWGVLFELTASGLAALDRREGEGRGYNRLERQVLDAHGGEVRCWAYLADPVAIVTDVKPTREYLRIVIAGATEHGLPEDYVRAIRSVAIT